MDSEFSFRVKSSDDLSFLNSGTYIVLFHATRIPPHLLIFHNGRIWDLSVKGTNRGLDVFSLLNFIDKKKVICLACEWQTGLPDSEFEKILNTEFARFDKAAAGKASCLFPIRNTVAAIHGEEFLQANFIFELLPMMKHNDLLRDIVLTNAKVPANGHFELLRYSQKELSEAIDLAATKANKA